jgi:hypothetical protein
MIEAVCIDLKWSGLSNITHKPVITEDAITDWKVTFLDGKQIILLYRKYLKIPKG